MMKKKIILAALLAVTMVVLCACSMEPGKVDAAENGFFMVYQKYMSGNIVVDTQTNVMYWMSTGPHNIGTLTMLVEKDGSPKIYRDGDG